MQGVQIECVDSDNEVEEFPEIEFELSDYSGNNLLTEHEYDDTYDHEFLEKVGRMFHLLSSQQSK